MLPPCQAILALISKLYLPVFVEATFDGRAAAQSLFHSHGDDTIHQIGGFAAGVLFGIPGCLR
jgi:hypothetical protein